MLDRFYRAAQVNGADWIVRATADNPFVDPVYIDKLIDFHLTQGNDYTKVEGLPWGVFSYAISYPAMVRACEIKTEKDTAVWGGYFTPTGLFKCGIFQVADQAVRWPELRLTVDTPEDMELITRIFDELYLPGDIFPLEDIVNLCRKRDDLVAINAKVVQKAAKQIVTIHYTK